MQYSKTIGKKWFEELFRDLKIVTFLFLWLLCEQISLPNYYLKVHISLDFSMLMQMNITY